MTHLLHKDQPRPNGVDSEGGIPALSTKEGCKGAQLFRADPNLSYSCSPLRRLGGGNYTSQEAVRPPSCPLPTPRPPGPAPASGRLVYKGRMARQPAERGGSADAR